LQQQAVYGQGATDDQNNATMPTSSDAPSNIVGDHIVNHNTDQRQTMNNKDKINDFEQWLKDWQSTPIETDYVKLTEKIAGIIDKPKITIPDY